MGIKDKPANASLAHAQVTAKAQEELESIARRQAEAQRRLSAASEEIQQIMSAAEARATRLTELRQQVVSIAEARAKANNYATTAMGTAGERQAMTTLKEHSKLLEESQQELTRAEEKSTVAETREASRLAVLHAEAQSAGQQLEELARRRGEIQQVHLQAQTDLGEAEYREAALVLEAQVRKVQADRQAVVASQLTLDQLIEDCISRLDEWPELAGKIRSQYSTYRDELTGILEAYDAFLSALRKANAAATIEPSIFRAAGSPWPDMTMLLEIPLDQLARALAGRGDRLVEKQDAAKKVLGAYRATKEVK